MNNSGLPPQEDGLHQVLIADEIIPAHATFHGHEALPEGFVPAEPVPLGFVLRSVLTREELNDTAAVTNFIQTGRRLRYRYGRDAVFTTSNISETWSRSVGAIANAEFVRYDAKPLPTLKRARRATSRAIFGIQCDVNF